MREGNSRLVTKLYVPPNRFPALALHCPATVDNCNSWLKLAAVCQKGGRPEESIHVLENGMQNLSLTHTTRFGLLKQFWEVYDSNAYHERESSRTPEQPALWRLLGKAHTAVGNHKQAMTCFQIAIEKGCGK